MSQVSLSVTRNTSRDDMEKMIQKELNTKRPKLIFPDVIFDGIANRIRLKV